MELVKTIAIIAIKIIITGTLLIAAGYIQRGEWAVGSEWILTALAMGIIIHNEKVKRDEKNRKFT